jgi:ornithine cyclodeaminase/alanine dehydrogenase-like protein (mu-crystallin family)
MTQFELIGSVVKLKRFAPVVDLQWADSLGEKGDLNLIDSYIVTAELAEHFEKVFESFTLKRHERKVLREGDIIDTATYPRAHILRGQYGTGKSYFLLMVSALLESMGNNELFDELYNKFHMFEGIRFHMDSLHQSNARYLVVRIDGVKNADMRFHELVQKRVIIGIQEAIGEADFYDSYGIAVRKLEEYMRDPIFSKLLEDALVNRGMSYDSLIEGLKASKRQYIKQYREIIESITRHKIDEGFDSLEEFLRSASSYIKSKGYTGLVILFDEFSAYISASIEDGRITTDLAAIQSLAQLTIPREQQDLYFICSMHIDIGRVLGNAETTAEEIQKVRGRFTEMTLSFTNSANLVENILVVDRDKFYNLQRKYKEYFGALPSRYPDMEKVYPIHPHTVNSIISVSGKFAQNERTIFSFFAEAVNRKLREPVVKDERLNLITTGDIYNYFIDTISERNAILKDSALRCMSFCKTDLEKDVLKALVIANVSAGEDSDSRLSSKDIAFILGVDNIRQIDTLLKELSANPASNIIFYEREYRFEFIVSGSTVADFSDSLDKDALKIEPYDALLNALDEYASTICIRKMYNINPSKDLLPVRKDLIGVIYRPLDLLKSLKSEISNIEKDGKLLFVVPDFNDRIENNFTESVKRMLVNAPVNVCIAVPKSFPYHFEKDIKFYTAARDKEKSGNIDENSKKTLKKILQSVEKIVDYEIKKFGNISNFTFIFNDSINNNVVEVDFSSLEELYKFLLKRHYNKFPRVEIDIIRGKNSIHMLVENFFMFGEKTNIPVNYSSEQDRLIMDLLRPLDLVKVERSGSGYSARLKIPEEVNNRESYEIWNIINDTSRSVNEVFALLEKAPYGLPNYMTELYIAAAVAANQLAITYRGQVMQLNKMSIALINTAGYTLEKVRTAPLELKNDVKKVWLVFCKINGRCNGKNFEPEVPQSDESIHSLIAADMADVRVILEGLEARLENSDVKNNTLLELMHALFDIRTVKNPVNYMETFVLMPQRVCGINNDYTAFEYFSNFFDFLAELSTSLDSIRQISTGLNDMRNLQDVQEEGYEALKTAYFEIISDFDILKKNISKDMFSSELLKELKGKLFNLIVGYNEAFRELHEEVFRKVKKLHTLLDSSTAELIEAFESISFKNIKRISDIRSELHRIKACDRKLMQKDDEPLNCSCIGFLAGLEGLLEQVQLLNHMEESILKQINNIGENHISRLLKFDEKADERSMILSDYLKTVEDTGDGKLTTLLQDWVSLKKYLEMRFEIVVDDYSEIVIGLLTGLAQHINTYLINSVEVKKQVEVEVEAKVKRKIAFRTLYEQIQSDIANSGFKSVSVDEFAKALQRIVDKLRKEYDEVDIEE